MNTLYQRLFDALIANWPLVAMGIPSIWYAKRTLDDIREQTKAAVTAANAAKNSADALIASERAWVMVDLEKVPGVGLVKGYSSYEGRNVSVRVKCICINQGKTPARIRNKQICLLLTTPNEPLPINPNLAIELFDSTPETLQSGQHSTRDWTLTCKGDTGMGNMVVVYGVVKYRHIFSDTEVRTTFGYRVTEDERLERLSDYPAYNNT
jgi:hypothetical protein